MEYSDESAGRLAEARGESGVRLAQHPHLSRQDVGSKRWIHSDSDAPELYFSEPAPLCLKCGKRAEFEVSPPGPMAIPFLYRIRCACGEDEIESAFPLCVGGDRAFWQELWANYRA